ncbi:MAG: tannase/feruloyl esterase family alpha/beta hydrolase [Gemmatimonadota bacterium]
MRFHLRTTSLLLPAMIALSVGATPARAQQPAAVETAAKCAALGGLDLSGTPDAVIQVLATTDVAQHGSQAGYCEVAGYVAPSVGFALRLPSDHWNGKFIELGCGGACGFTAHVAACAEPVQRGYACIVSDGGHKARGDVKWAYNHPEAVLEYFVRASHVTAIAGKVISERYYHEAPQKSYFLGCSAGGLQGTVEAERFPWDFDGIVVGAPSLSLTGLWLSLMSANRALTRPDGEPTLGPADLETLHQAVVARCDLNDGLKDGLIGDPRACGFKPSELLCAAGNTTGCLTGPQVDAVNRIYGGAVTSKGEQIVAPTVQKGSELTWLEFLSGSAAKPNSTYEYFADWGRYFLLQPNPGPAWKPSEFDFDRDYKRMGMAEVVEPANSPDLRRFKARGGKLLSYMGWSDPAGGVLTTVDFYETAERVVGGRQATQDFYRLFMVPGMYHCGNGEGASTVDWLSYLEAWVEKGQAPNEIVGAHLKATPPGASGNPFPIPRPDPAQIQFTRPIYPYPVVAKYRGKGDPNDAGSFRAVEP